MKYLCSKQKAMHVKSLLMSDLGVKLMASVENLGLMIGRKGFFRLVQACKGMYRAHFLEVSWRCFAHVGKWPNKYSKTRSSKPENVNSKPVHLWTRVTFWTVGGERSPTNIKKHGESSFPGWLSW